MIRDERLYKAALQGDVNSLLKLVKEDALILDRCMVTGSLAETPLHISAMLGHEEFTKLILKLKPELVGELNSDSSTALHLASARGYVEIVKELLSVKNSETMCSKRNRNGLTPLHIAAIKGRLSVVKELIQASRPDAVRAPADHGDTVLHLCVRHNQLDALKLLMETMGHDEDFVNSKDDYGNTILHCAVACSASVEMITYLVSVTPFELVNEVNVNGFTALDLLAQTRSDGSIGECLRSAGAMRAKDIKFPNLSSVREIEIIRSSTPPPRKRSGPQRGRGRIRSIRLGGDVQKKEVGGWTEKNRDALMVIASLIATMAFQIAVNPPGGCRQDGPDVGMAIMSEKYPALYETLITLNTASFFGALSVVLLLISGLHIRVKFFVWVMIVSMWVTISLTALTYIATLLLLTRPNGYYSMFKVVNGITYFWISVMLLVALLNCIRLVLEMVRWFRKMVRWFRKRRASSTPSNLNPINV